MNSPLRFNVAPDAVTLGPPRASGSEAQTRAGRHEHCIGLPTYPIKRLVWPYGMRAYLQDCFIRAVSRAWIQRPGTMASTAARQRST